MVIAIVMFALGILFAGVGFYVHQQLDEGEAAMQTPEMQYELMKAGFQEPGVGGRLNRKVGELRDYATAGLWVGGLLAAVSCGLFMFSASASTPRK